ncbi:unnamed protein product [Protopolystoma xenopodis]|uniref:Uncharacterized protein n=1 Tax=Protopolystoma xenopodis TaxID=117903 RepID=A0A3S5A491_9PLAT|nr:unnamed protein product [Protopolystoma xenopodis]
MATLRMKQTRLYRYFSPHVPQARVSSGLSLTCNSAMSFQRKDKTQSTSPHRTQHHFEPASLARRFAISAVQHSFTSPRPNLHDAKATTDPGLRTRTHGPTTAQPKQKGARVDAFSSSRSHDHPMFHPLAHQPDSLSIHIRTFLLVCEAGWQPETGVARAEAGEDRRNAKAHSAQPTFEEHLHPESRTFSYSCFSPHMHTCTSFDLPIALYHFGTCLTWCPMALCRFHIFCLSDRYQRSGRANPFKLWTLEGVSTELPVTHRRPSTGDVGNPASRPHSIGRAFNTHSIPLVGLVDLSSAPMAKAPSHEPRLAFPYSL